MAPKFIATVACNYCSKFRPEYRIHRLTDAQVICDQCLDWHIKALEVLGGQTGHGCQGCNATWETIRDRDPQGERLWVVPRDGIYQLLCKNCLRGYLPKRADLYANTRFGKESLKL